MQFGHEPPMFAGRYSYRCLSRGSHREEVRQVSAGGLWQAGTPRHGGRPEARLFPGSHEAVDLGPALEGLNLAKAEISAKWRPGDQAPPAELSLSSKGPEVVVTQCPQARLGIHLRGGKVQVPKKLLHLVNRHKPRIEQDRRDGMPQ
jgi:hypothetical protein